jgi:hypothetical protein
MILSALFLAIAFIGMGIRVLLKSHGRFPEIHVGRNKELRKKGITCAKNTDIGCHSPNCFPGCPTCNDRML